MSCSRSKQTARRSPFFEGPAKRVCAPRQSRRTYVTVEGPVAIEAPDVAVDASLACRYLGEELGDIYLGAIADSVTFVVRLSPARWRTVDYGPFVERVLAGG
jgi:hypothetical protein